jgi:hypothetical protein
VFYRANGRLELYRSGVSIAIADTGLLPTAATRRVKVVARGRSIRVYVNGVLRIDTIDSTYAAGYLDLSEDSATVRFDGLNVY